MICVNVETCYNAITEYFASEISGYPFIVNIDDYSAYQQIVAKMHADSTKKALKLSDYCGDSDSMPDMFDLHKDMVEDGDFVVVGMSAYLMLFGESELRREIACLIELPINGHTVILLNNCGNILQLCIGSDLRLARRIAVAKFSETVKLPKIVLADEQSAGLNSGFCNGIKALLKRLETLESNDVPEIIVKSGFSLSVFADSMYSISPYGDAYDVLCKKYADVASSTECSWGTNDQWNDMLSQMDTFKSLSAVIENKIGTTVNLSFFIDDLFDEDTMKVWYDWLAMKVFGTKENTYLSLAVQKSNSPEELISKIYMELLDHHVDEENFRKLFTERYQLLEKMPEDLALLQRYCDHVCQYEKEYVYYLTDLSYKEKLLLLKAFIAYDYSEEEIISVTSGAFHELYDYLYEYKFTLMNTRVPSGDTEIYTRLTEYFNEYKFYKVTNQKASGDFLERVKLNAKERPFNKLLPRISVVNDIDKNNAQLHFFDALGVEYLSYIVAKCEKYKLQAAVHVAHCEMPSITKE
ncbi:MAG: BREX-4 system phosphatase PglZ, partial [Eubacterium sp.]|nr:BREX-4 system phosphatase PglZ [Eubacterium sp.]